MRVREAREREAAVAPCADDEKHLMSAKATNEEVEAI